jgi:hypothetical protein
MCNLYSITTNQEAISRDDYRALEEKRDDCVATLVTVRARSLIGIQSKASAFRLDRMIEDYDQHQRGFSGR